MSAQRPVVVLLAELGSESHLLARAIEQSLAAAGAELTVRHSAGGVLDMFSTAAAPPACIVAIDPGGLVPLQPAIIRGQTLVVGLLADLVVPEAWDRVPPPHAALVAHRTLVKPMAALGVPEAAVVATGVPLPPSHQPADPAEVRRELGVSAKRLVFLSGRGLGIGRIDRLLVQLGVLAPDLELFVDLEDADITIVAQRMKLLGLRARKMRDVGMTGRLVSASDLVVGAPTPLQLLAAMAAGRPVLVAEPKGDDQVGRAAFLEAHGAGGALVGTAGAAARLKSFDDPAVTSAAAEACRTVFAPGAERNVALALDGLIRNRERLISYSKEVARTRERVAQAPTPADHGLEDIGADVDEISAAKERAVDKEIRAIQVDRELEELKKRLGR